MIKAVLFDIDGVLVDACDIHFRALNKALGFNLTKQEHLTVYNGLSTKKKLEMLVSQGRIKSTDVERIWKLKQDYTIQEISELSLDPVKITMHMMLRKNSIMSVCVTNAIRQTASVMLDKTGQLNFIEFIISNEDVEKNKPYPDPYLKALNILHLSPTEIMIVEDSDIGYQSASSVTKNILRVKDSYDVDSSTILSAIREFELS